MTAKKVKGTVLGLLFAFWFKSVEGSGTKWTDRTCFFTRGSLGVRVNSVRGVAWLETGCERPGLEFLFPLGVVDVRSYCKSVRLSCFSGLCKVRMSGACTSRREQTLRSDDRVFSLEVCRCQTSVRTIDGCGSGL